MICWKCSKYCEEFESICPHCGASTKQSRDVPSQFLKEQTLKGNLNNLRVERMKIGLRRTAYDPNTVFFSIDLCDKENNVLSHAVQPTPVELLEKETIYLWIEDIERALVFNLG